MNSRMAEDIRVNEIKQEENQTCNNASHQNGKLQDVEMDDSNDRVVNSENIMVKQEVAYEVLVDEELHIKEEVEDDDKKKWYVLKISPQRFCLNLKTTFTTV